MDRATKVSHFHDRRVAVLRLILPTAALRRILFWSLAMAAYGGLAVWKEQGPFANYGDIPVGMEGALSLVIGLLLAFRLNRAFDRWWEGRILWGMLVNACRNLAVKVNNVLVERDESFDRLQRLLIAYPVALRDHLREGTAVSRLSGFEDEQSKAEHVPSWIVNQIYGTFEVWKRQQRIQYGEFRMLDRESKVLLEVCGGCERIRNTPIAISYRVFLYETIACFLLTLPWGIVDDFGLWTIPIVFLSSYFVIAAEGIADHVEQPFTADGDGLDLDSICHAIETTVQEILATDTVAKDNV